MLEPAGVDYSSIKIRYMGERAGSSKSVSTLEQDVLEQEGQEQHVPVQTM